MLITSPLVVKALAAEKQNENIGFRAFLKKQPSKKLDETVRLLGDEVSKQIDCTQCANCCKHLHPSFTQKEIENLAESRNKSVEALRNEFDFDTNDHVFRMKHSPCFLLKDNLCTVYSNRPFACADYPHLHKPDFKYRLHSVFSNYEICPIVFNTMEQLKKNLGFS